MVDTLLDLELGTLTPKIIVKREENKKSNRIASHLRFAALKSLLNIRLL